MCVGGYAQIPYALAAGGGGDEQPVLDIRYDKAVDEIRVIPCGDEGISGDESPLGMVRVTCSDGSYFDADAVVVTAPLGVLQHSLSATSSSTTSPSNITQQQHLDQTMDQSSDKQHQLPSSSSPSITFSPPLPPWKVEAINRLGFGFFTKVVLVFKEMFWDPATSIFGCLNEKIDDDSANSASSSSHSSASTSSSSSHPSASSWLDSASTDAFTPSRGQFFTFWNMYPVTGVPVLVGFISGRAAVEMDTLSDDEIVGRALVVLKKIFCGTGGGSYHGVDKQDKVVPLESIVSRWK